MSLSSRIAAHQSRPLPTRLCVDCGAHAAIPDGNRCPACLAGLLRATRPRPRATVSPFVERARARQLPAKVVAA